VLLTRRSAIALGVGIGDQLVIPAFAAEPVQAGSGDPFPTTVSVAGLYRPPNSGEPYWFDQDLFEFRPPTVTMREPRPARLDAVFATRDLLRALRSVSIMATADRVLDVASVRVDDLDRMDDVFTEHITPNRSFHQGAGRQSSLPQLIGQLEDERAFVQTATLLVAAQLLVLAWYALAIVVTSTSEARNGEVALAKLRGLPLRATFRRGMAEPVLLLAVAVPIGGLLAYAGVRVLGRLYLVPDTPVTLRWPVVAAVGLALAGAVSAVIFASQRSLRQPVVDQLRRVVPTAGLGRVLAGEAVLVATAVIGVYQLVDLGPEASQNGLGLLAPGLVAAAVGIVAGRVVVLAARAWARRTRWRPRVPAFLASRQIARRAGLARTVVLVTVAVGVSTFAVQAWSIAATYRDGRAAMEVGAATVLDVGAASPLGLADAVERVDPGGEHAMAVTLFDDPAVPPQRRMIAVDTSRLATVSTWHPTWSETAVTTLADQMVPGESGRLDVQGTHWRVDVETRLVSRTHPPLLQAQVRTADGLPATLLLGRLEHGGTVVESDHPECDRGCRLIGLTFVRAPGELGQLGATAVFRTLSVDGAGVDDAFAPADWRPQLLGERREASAEVTDAPGGGLQVSFLSGVTDVPAILRADVAVTVPAVVTASTDAGQFRASRALFAAGPSGERVELADVGRAVVLPVLGRYGAMVDIEVAGLHTDTEGVGLRYQVWLGREAPESIVGALQREGLDVLDVRTVGEREAELDAEGPALALLLLLFGAAVALATAGTAVIASAFVEARRRAYEFAALRTVGVAMPGLRFAATIETGVLLAVGTVLGIVCGIATAWLATTAVPVSTDPASGPPVSATLSWELLGVVAASAVVLLSVAGYLISRHVVATSRPALLREAQA
jgi:hypothetical protein